jgi:hypothetical protein
LTREITRSKTYNNKSDIIKKRDGSLKRLKEDLDELNVNIENNDRELDKEDRNLKDRNLLKRQNEVTFDLKRQHGKVEIDINIGKSKLQELQGLREMALRAIEEIYSEKLSVEKENDIIDNKIQGKGISDDAQKVKQVNAEAAQLKKIDNNIKYQEQKVKILMEQLTYEETKGKEMLDQKHKLQQDLQQMDEDVDMAKEDHAIKRQEIINMRIELSQLSLLEEKKKAEDKRLKEENARLIKENNAFEESNVKLTKEIDITVQRIDINNLLKHIDLEDVRLQTMNNQKMTGMVNGLINKWEQLEKSVDP